MRFEAVASADAVEAEFASVVSSASREIWVTTPAASAVNAPAVQPLARSPQLRRLSPRGRHREIGVFLPPASGLVGGERNQARGGRTERKMFEALEVAVTMTRAAREPAKKIHARSADLSDQFRRAVESTALNLGEARWRTGKDRTNRYRYAAGSAQEAHTAIRLALAWGYLTPGDVHEVMPLLDRVMAMCWRLLQCKK